MFNKGLYGFYFNIIKLFPFYFITMFLCLLGSNFISMIAGSVTSKLTFGLFEQAASITAKELFIGLLAIFALNAAPDLFSTIISFLRGYRSEKISHLRNKKIYERLFQNETMFFLNRPSGQIVTRVQDINSGMEQMTFRFWAQIGGVVLAFLFVAGYIFTINTILAIIIIACGLFRIIWQMTLQPTINNLHKQQQDVGSKFLGARTDSFENSLTVKLFGNEEHENKYIMQQRHPLIAITRKLCYLDRLQSLPVGLVWSITTLTVIAVSFQQIRAGTMLVSDAAFIITATTAIFNAFSKLNTTIRNYSEIRAKSTHAYTDLFSKIGITDSPNAKKLKVSQGAISFNNISFKYTNKRILHNFTLNIAPGERIGIVGLSGSGKTTLCHLLLRLWDIQNGEITIDNTDIRTVTQESLRKNIAFVPQEPVLFNRTILDNIRYGCPTATNTQVIKACKQANIHSFINTLPDGYQTIVGNRGVKLSGGQRQRIAIARAILKNAPIFILDEATSALDSKNETSIQSALNTVMHNKTSLVIAHRLSTLRNMDRIIVMDQGKIIETGTHHQLLRQKGLYKKLWSMQTNGFLKT